MFVLYFSEHKISEVKLNCNGAAEIPVYLLKFTRLLHDDPDPYFDSYYNWYLSGNGNLCLADIAGNTYLLKSSSNELGELINYKAWLLSCCGFV